MCFTPARSVWHDWQRSFVHWLPACACLTWCARLCAAAIQGLVTAITGESQHASTEVAERVIEYISRMVVLLRDQSPEARKRLLVAHKGKWPVQIMHDCKVCFL